MNIQTLLPGINFAIKHSLTNKEARVLREFILHKTRTAQEIADALEYGKTLAHHDIQRLKMKNLIVLKDRDKKGTNLYKFNINF